MTPIEFEGVDTVFAKDQPQYNQLPAQRTPEGEVITCWELTEEEKQTLQETGQIWLRVHTFNQPLQPVMLSVESLKV
jgi:hypothetical protein